VTEKVLWTLPADRVGKNVPGEFTGLNIAAGNHPLMIEIEAKCDRFEVARVAWANRRWLQARAGNGVHRRLSRRGMPDAPRHDCHRGHPITALRLQFPAAATVDLKQVRIRELSVQPLPSE